MSDEHITDPAATDDIPGETPVQKALRLKNAIRQGDLTPTGAPMDENTGDLPACLAKVKERLEWDSKPHRLVLPGGKIRSKGISCFWKAPWNPLKRG